MTFSLDLKPYPARAVLRRSTAPQHRFAMTLFAFVFALAYSSFLANLPLDVFKDRLNYFVYASSSDIILTRYTVNNLSFLSNEPLWLYLNIFLSRFLYPDDLVKFIVFAPAFLTSFFVIRSDSKNAIWLIVILILPQVVKNNIIHLRQGVAISLFIIGYYSNSKPLRFILMAAAPLIHSSFFFILMIWGITYATGVLRLSVAMRVLFFTACYAVVALLLLVAASNLGARQALLYESIDPEVSGFGFMFWSSILILFLSAGTDFVRRFAFPISILTFYLATYFAVPFSARILESGLLIILLAGLSLDNWRRPAFLMLLILFTIVSYATRWGQPWLGWGL